MAHDTKAETRTDLLRLIDEVHTLKGRQDFQAIPFGVLENLDRALEALGAAVAFNQRRDDDP